MKQKVSIPLDEQELHINYAPEMEKMCEVYTTIPHMMKYLEKMVNKYPDLCRVVKDDQYSYTVQIPFKLVKPRNPRIVPDEQREAARQRLAEARNKSVSPASRAG